MHAVQVQQSSPHHLLEYFTCLEKFTGYSIAYVLNECLSRAEVSKSSIIIIFNHSIINIT